MKKLRKLFVCSLLILSVGQSYSQSYDQLKVQLQFESYYGAPLRSSIERREMAGPIFLYDDWLPLEVELPNGTVRFEEGKINLQNTMVEVIYKDQEKIIAPHNLKNVWMPTLSKKFTPASNYKYNEVSLLGFMEIFGEDAPCIMTNHYVYIKKANNDGYVNAGVTEDKLMKATNNYLFDGSTLWLVRNQKDIVKVYPQHKQSIKKLSTSLTTNFSDPRSLQKLIVEIRRLN
ncbi:MAG: hypothetical protein OEU76_04440 [Cyclobacteriaceae bacterium]|nr:hypothetical protein [Cyclobacteriaceae bacterium]